MKALKYFTLLLLSMPFHVSIAKDNKIFYCEHEVKKYEHVYQLIRYYNFTKNVELVDYDLTRVLNLNNKDLDYIHAGDRVLIPVFTQAGLAAHKSCISEFEQDRQPANENLAIKDKLKSRLTYLFGWNYDALTNQSSTGSTITSSIQPQLGLKWSQVWSGNWVSYISLQTTMHSYTDPKTAGKTLKTRKPITSESQLGGEYYWQDGSNLVFFVGVDEAHYLVQTSENIFEVLTEPAGILGAEFEYKLIKKDPLSFGLKAGATFYTDGKSRFKGGLLYSAGFLIQHDFQAASLLAEAKYQTGVLEVSTYKYDYENFQIIFSYAKEFR